MFAGRPSFPQEDGLKGELHDGDIIRFLHISPKFDTQ